MTDGQARPKRRNQSPDREVWTPEYREAVLSTREQAERYYANGPSGPESGTWQFKGPGGLFARVPGKLAAAIVTLLIASFGGGAALKDTIAPSTTESEELALLKSQVLTLNGLVVDVQRTQSRVVSRLYGLQLLGLGKAQWDAKRAGDREEVRRLQGEIDKVTQEMERGQ